MDLPATPNLVFELGVYALALWILVAAFRESRFGGAIVVIAMVYAFVIESTDIRETHPFFYDRFWVMLGDDPDWVPLCICVAWGAIVFATLRTARAFRLRWWQIPFVAALLAVSLDLFLDPIASGSRLVPKAGELCNAGGFPPGGAEGIGFWIWCVAPVEKQLWLGVPLGNFYGWLSMVGGFAFAVELFRRFVDPESKGLLLQLGCVLCVAVLAALVTFGLMAVYQLVVARGVTVWLPFAALCAPGVVILARRLPRTRGTRALDPVTLAIPLFDGAFCLGALVFAGVGGRTSTASLVVLVSAIGVSLALFVWPYRLRRTSGVAS